MKRIVLFLCCLAATAAAGPTPSVAVLGLEVKAKGGAVDKASVKTARAVTEGLRAGARAGKPYRLAAGSTDKDLVDVKLLAGCEDEGAGGTACLAQIGSDLAADFLVVGKVTQRGTDLELQVMLFDVTAKAEVRTAVRTMQAGATTAAADGASVYRELVGHMGQLQVRSNLTNGVLFVDGQEQGVLSDGQLLLDVAPGIHKLKVRDPSTGQETSRTVEVASGSITTANMKVATSGRGGNKAWKIAALASGAAAVGGGALWVYGYSRVDEAEAKLCTGRHRSDTGCPQMAVTGREYDEWVSTGNSGRTMTIVGGTVVALGSAAMLYGIYKGFIADDGGTTVGQRQAPRGTSVAVVPTISPDGVGTTVRFEF